MSFRFRRKAFDDGAMPTGGGGPSAGPLTEGAIFEAFEAARAAPPKREGSTRSFGGRQGYRESRFGSTKGLRASAKNLLLRRRSSSSSLPLGGLPPQPQEQLIDGSDGSLSTRPHSLIDPMSTRRSRMSVGSTDSLATELMHTQRTKWALSNDMRDKLRDAQDQERGRVERQGDKGTLTLVVRRAEHLRPADPNGKADPYVKVKLGSEPVRATRVIRESLRPKWEKSFEYKGVLLALTKEGLLLQLWDKDTFSRDDLMGTVRLAAEQLQARMLASENLLPDGDGDFAAELACEITEPPEGWPITAPGQADTTPMLHFSLGWEVTSRVDRAERAIAMAVKTARRPPFGGSEWSEGMWARRVRQEDVDAVGTAEPDTEQAAQALHSRGVTLRWLVQFSNEHDCWRWRTAEVVERLVRPHTAAARCRYADLRPMRQKENGLPLGVVGAADVYVSHCWGARWGQLVAALATAPDASPSRRVWLDIFAVRQWPGSRADMCWARVLRRCERLCLCNDAQPVLRFNGTDCVGGLTSVQMLARASQLMWPQARRALALHRAWCLTELLVALDMRDMRVEVRVGSLEERKKTPAQHEAEAEAEAARQERQRRQRLQRLQRPEEEEGRQQPSSPLKSALRASNARAAGGEGGGDRAAAAAAAGGGGDGDGDGDGSLLGGRYRFKAQPGMARALLHLLDLEKAEATLPDDLAACRAVAEARPGGLHLANEALRVAVGSFVSRVPTRHEPHDSRARLGVFPTEQLTAWAAWAAARADADADGDGDAPATELLARMLRLGALPNSFACGGEAPLFAAVRRGQLQALHTLLQHLGLDSALKMGTEACRRAIDGTTSPFDGQTALVVACGGNAATVPHDTSSETALAASLAVTRAASQIPNQIEVVEMLLRWGADPNRPSHDWVLRPAHMHARRLGLETLPPLRAAAYGGHDKIVELLVRAQANVEDVANALKNTPLHVACEQGHTATARAILKASRAHGGATTRAAKQRAQYYFVNRRNRDGMTALHLASRGGHMGTVQFLVDHKADPNRRNQQGEDPISSARTAGQESVAEWLDTFRTNSPTVKQVD